MPLSTDDYRQDRSITYAAPPSPRRTAIGSCLLLLFIAASLFAAGMLCILGTMGTMALAIRVFGWAIGVQP